LSDPKGGGKGGKGKTGNATATKKDLKIGSTHGAEEKRTMISLLKRGEGRHLLEKGGAKEKVRKTRTNEK